MFLRRVAPGSNRRLDIFRDIIIIISRPRLAGRIFIAFFARACTHFDNGLYVHVCVFAIAKRSRVVVVVVC